MAQAPTVAHQCISLTLHLGKCELSITFEPVAIKSRSGASWLLVNICNNGRYWIPAGGSSDTFFRWKMHNLSVEFLHIYLFYLLFAPSGPKLWWLALFTVGSTCVLPALPKQLDVLYRKAKDCVQGNLPASEILIRFLGTSVVRATLFLTFQHRLKSRRKFQEW